jgi:glutathione S-transferase
MKLYFAKGACSLAVRIVINEIGLHCDYEEVDLKTKKTASGKDFLAINPKGQVPTLVTDDKEILTENAVIQQYLADMAHAEHLLPTPDHFERYKVLEWLNYVTTEMHQGVGILFKSTITNEVRDQIFLPLINKKLAFLDQHLNQHRYLNGDHFTLPDAYLYVILTWTVHFKIDLKPYPHLFHYFMELQKRPAVKKSLQEEHLIPA